MKARVIVTMKEGTEDVAGAAVCHGLKALGHSGVSAVSTGRVFILEMEKDGIAQNELVEICETLLVDKSREAFTIEFVED
jgi:phosphoribosylformylglycinamidine synthase PurS subunit